MTPPGVPGAVAIIQVQGNVPLAFSTLEMKELGVGGVGVRPLFGVDRALVARVSDSCLQLMPHGGTAVVREILLQLGARGFPEAPTPVPELDYPEASDEIEARMLHALSTAISPLAVDLLLDQPRRWRASGGIDGDRVDPGHAAALRHLLTPALVVMVGPANVGKSTLLNRLSGRGVAIVADEPGTTRDHVGVLLDVGGLVVRFVDTPGKRSDPGAIEAEAMANARRLTEQADLILAIADTGAAFVDESIVGPHRSKGIRVGLRSDLGVIRGADISVSALTGDGIEELTRAIRDSLVPEEALQDPRPWMFWDL